MATCGNYARVSRRELDNIPLVKDFLEREDYADHEKENIVAAYCLRDAAYSPEEFVDEIIRCGLRKLGHRFGETRREAIRELAAEGGTNEAFYNELTIDQLLFLGW